MVVPRRYYPPYQENRVAGSGTLIGINEVFIRDALTLHVLYVH